MRSGLLIIALLSACADRETVERHAAESACYSAELAGYRADMKAMEGHYKQARSANTSTVEIVIERQRRIEQYCLASARCYGSTGAGLSNLFEWCLEDERE